MPDLRRAQIQAEGQGIETAPSQLPTSASVLGQVPQIVELAGILLDVEQLPKVVSVVRDKLVPPGSEHRSVAALKLSDEAWPVRIEGAVILTAYKVTVDMGVGASRQQRGERAPLHALGY